MGCDGIAEKRSCRNSCQTMAQSGQQNRASFCIMEDPGFQNLGSSRHQDRNIAYPTTSDGSAIEGEREESRRPLLPLACIHGQVPAHGTRTYGKTIEYKKKFSLNSTNNRCTRSPNHPTVLAGIGKSVASQTGDCNSMHVKGDHIPGLYTKNKLENRASFLDVSLVRAVVRDAKCMPIHSLCPRNRNTIHVSNPVATR